MEPSGKAAVRGKPSPKRQPDEQAGSDPLVSSALRTAYEEAVREEIPSEFLDLLNKLS